MSDISLVRGVFSGVTFNNYMIVADNLAFLDTKTLRKFTNFY